MPANIARRTLDSNDAYDNLFDDVARFGSTDSLDDENEDEMGIRRPDKYSTSNSVFNRLNQT